MSTIFQYDGRKLEASCALSQADTFPCFEFLDSKRSPQHVDLVCNASHFTRMTVEFDNTSGKTHLVSDTDNKTIIDFIDEFRNTYSKFPDKDKELFENFVSFAAIEHTYGIAISIRILMEDFLKDNYIVPAISRELSNGNKQTLMLKSKNENIDYSSNALKIMTFTEFMKVMRGGYNLSSNPKLKGYLMKAVCDYITSNGEGQKIRIDPDDSDAILKVFNIVSGVIHGKKFDALQIFNASVPFLKLTEKYIEKGVEWGVV